MAETLNWMRGSNTLFADIFDEEPVIQQQKPERLINKRNEMLIDRYFYYALQKLRYSAILQNLSNEFFISIITIPSIIADKYDYLSMLKRNPLTVKQLREKWPFMVW